MLRTFSFGRGKKDSASKQSAAENGASGEAKATRKISRAHSFSHQQPKAPELTPVEQCRAPASRQIMRSHSFTRGIFDHRSDDGVGEVTGCHQFVLVKPTVPALPRRSPRSLRARSLGIRGSFSPLPISTTVP